MPQNGNDRMDRGRGDRGRGDGGARGRPAKRRNEELSSSRSVARSDAEGTKKQKKDQNRSEPDSRRISCRNLPADMQEQQVIEFFQGQCECLVSWVELDDGIATLQFANTAGVQNALQKVNGHKFFGGDTALRVDVEQESPAREQEPPPANKQDDNAGGRARSSTRSEGSESSRVDLRNKGPNIKRGGRQNDGRENSTFPKFDAKAQNGHHGNGGNKGRSPLPPRGAGGKDRVGKGDRTPAGGDRGGAGIDMKRPVRRVSDNGNADEPVPRVIMRNLPQGLQEADFQAIAELVGPTDGRTRIFPENTDKGPRVWKGSVQYLNHTDVVRAIAYFENKYIDKCPHPIKCTVERDTKHDFTVIYSKDHVAASRNNKGGGFRR
ncbi:unnamed protein product [Amoebophrya sp. A25]|nr:unnamed protein product [Amoebophrya sp. A25]|eukprot:GSA25T00000171001.1